MIYIHLSGMPSSFSHSVTTPSVKSQALRSSATTIFKSTVFLEMASLGVTVV